MSKDPYNKVIECEAEIIAVKETENGDTYCIDTEPFGEEAEEAHYFEVFVRVTYQDPLPESGCNWDITETYEFPTLDEAEVKREELEKEFETKYPE